MPEDGPKLRQQAVGRMRQAKAVWATLAASEFVVGGIVVARFVRAANRAETALFRVACGALDDPRPRAAYGEIASLRSWTLASCESRRMVAGMAASGSVGAARGALWAFDRSEFRGLDPEGIALIAAQPPIETEFTSAEGVAGILYGENRVAAAADARFALAERLATFQPRPCGDAITPQALDVTLRSREKVSMFDEGLVWRCQLASCRGRDGVGEARILATEAADMYRILADLGGRFGLDDTSKAEQRRDAILKRLPLYFGD